MRLLQFFMLSMSMVMLTACADPVGDELVDYLNEHYNSFLDMDSEKDEYYQLYEMSAAEGDEGEMAAINREQLNPHLEQMYTMLESVELEHEEVQELHHLLLDEVRYQWEAVQVEREGFEVALNDDSEESYDEARQLFEKRDEYYERSYYRMTEFLELLDEMIDMYNIEVTEGENRDIGE